jgi:formiminoglutamate deiminase
VIEHHWCELALVDGVVRESVAIGVAEGRFESVAADVPAPQGAVVHRGLTIPGLANAHSHAFHRALRSRTQADRGSFWTWRELMYRAAARLDPDRYHRLARATFAEMALAGVTAVGEFHYLHHRPDGKPYADPNAMGRALLAAAAEAGIRITLLDTLYLQGGLDAAGHIAPTAAQARFDDRSVERWVERVDELHDDVHGDGRAMIGAAIHSVRAATPEAMREVASWATTSGLPLHAHVSEQPAENDQCRAAFGCTPIELLRDAGALSNRFTAVHATHVTTTDIDALAAVGATVCMCPTTERDLADGIGPTTQFAEAGVPMALGSDSHAVIDLFEEARALELDERLRSGARGAHAAAALIAAAAEHGHRSLGWYDAGSIAVGRRADLVTVALDSVRTAGASAGVACETVVFAATAADVSDVVVDGCPIVTDRHHREIDTPGELHRAIIELMEDAG